MWYNLALFGHGNGKIFRKITDSGRSLIATDTLACHTVSVDNIVVAGLQLLVQVCGGKPGDTLNNMRYSAYLNMLANSTTSPRPKRLPPTEAAARQHILRVHLQVVQWCSLMRIDKKTEDCGCKLVQGVYMPSERTELAIGICIWYHFVKCSTCLRRQGLVIMPNLCDCIYGWWPNFPTPIRGYMISCAMDCMQFVVLIATGQDFQQI